MDTTSAPLSEIHAVERRAATPIAGAIAGILFAVLFSACMLIIVGTISSVAQDTGEWLRTDLNRFRLAVDMLPFSGIFFLWFIAVSREHVGKREDQFFATIYLGSGLLFLAMVFTAAATAGAIAAYYVSEPAGFIGSGTYLFARQTLAQIFGIYALRMAAVFVLSQATIWLRTETMPKWMSYLSYAVALVLLFVVSQATLVVLIFPAWVFVVSAFILVVSLRRKLQASPA